MINSVHENMNKGEMDQYILTCQTGPNISEPFLLSPTFLNSFFQQCQQVRQFCQVMVLINYIKMLTNHKIQSKRMKTSNVLLSYSNRGLL